MEAELIYRVAGFALLMVLSAGFSASETAFFSLSRVRVQTFHRESRLGRYIASLLERPRRLIISILMAGCGIGLGYLLYGRKPLEAGQRDPLLVREGLPANAEGSGT